jgi:hypothetical protein
VVGEVVAASELSPVLLAAAFESAPSVPAAGAVAGAFLKNPSVGCGAGAGTAGRKGDELVLVLVLLPLAAVFPASAAFAALAGFTRSA